MIEVTHFTPFSDLGMEDWGSEYKARRLCTKTAVTFTVGGQEQGQFRSRIQTGSYTAPGSAKTRHLLSLVILRFVR